MWWWRLKDESQLAYRERLFSAYAKFARMLARRHAWRAHEREAVNDAQHWAYEGLLQAIDHFDMWRGVPFKAFARPRIAGSVHDGMSKLGELDAQHYARRRAERDRVASLRSQPDASLDPLVEIGRLATGLAVGIMLEGTRVLDGGGVADPEPSPYDTLAWHQLQAGLSSQVGKLPDNEARVMRLHYQDGLSFVQIAVLLELTKGRISQIHRSAVERLRKRISKEDFA